MVISHINGNSSTMSAAKISGLLLASMLVVCETKSVMFIENNAYQNVVIVIGEHVKENWKLVDRIKEVFENGSEFIYQVTRYLFKYVHVEITE